MKKILILCASAATLMACGNNKQKEADKKKAETITPAKPAGTVGVTFDGLDKDTNTVNFTFVIDTIHYEKSFKDIPLIKGFPDTSIYRVLWDQPNSVWIGLVKSDRDTRYYHGSQDGPLLVIHWVPSPPAKIFNYMEKTMGLGDIVRSQPRVKKYKQNFQSGQIIADFIVEIQPASSPTEVNIFIEFGGVTRVLNMPVPEGMKPYVQAYKQDDVFVGLEKDGELEEVYEVKVIDGRIGARQLKAVN